MKWTDACSSCTGGVRITSWSYECSAWNAILVRVQPQLRRFLLCDAREFFRIQMSIVEAFGCSGHGVMVLLSQFTLDSLRVTTIFLSLVGVRFTFFVSRLMFIRC